MRQSLACTFILGMAVIVTALAQAQKPSFEVASVKRNVAGRGPSVPPIRTAGDRFLATDATLKTLLQFGYRASNGRILRYGDIIGAPAWADTDDFDIDAKAQGEGAQIPQDRIRLMVQSLLADRFQLKVHWEPREMEVFNLTVTKDGPKLKSPSDAPSAPQLIAMPSPTGLTLTLTQKAISISDFANWLQQYAGRPVIDKSSLQGLYDVRLQFFMESRPTDAGPQNLAADPSGPSIFTAIQEQLGLRLESTRGPVEVLVIDSVSKPSEN